jgi:hypothetical protein
LNQPRNGIKTVRNLPHRPCQLQVVFKNFHHPGSRKVTRKGVKGVKGFVLASAMHTFADDPLLASNHTIVCSPTSHQRGIPQWARGRTLQNESYLFSRIESFLSIEVFLGMMAKNKSEIGIKRTERLEHQAPCGLEVQRAWMKRTRKVKEKIRK